MLGIEFSLLVCDVLYCYDTYSLKFYHFEFRYFFPLGTGDDYFLDTLDDNVFCIHAYFSFV